MSENMKPSGIAWIGDVPESWSIKRVKFIIDNIKDGTHGTFDRVDSGEMLLSAKNVFDEGLLIGDNESEVSNRDYLSIVSNGFPQKGDVLLCCVGTIGRTCVFNYDRPLAFQRSVAFLRPDGKTDSNYLKYCLQSESTIVQEQLLINKSAQDGLYMGSVKELMVAYATSLSEQTLIAEFLDEQCEIIGRIRTDIEKQIEILQKYKKSLITEAVTKGLDKSVSMKNSGIEWIGDIPEHWEIKRVKFVSLKIGSGKTPKGGAEIYEEEGITFIRSQNVYDDGLHLDDVKFISKDINNEMSSTQLQPGDILFNITGASIGRCCIYSLKAIGNVNQHVCIIRTNNSCFNAYLRYVMVSEIGKIQTAINQMGGNRDSLTFEQIGNFVIPVAQSNEQIKIANYLDQQCSKIDSIIESKKEQLTIILQHKKSLIYEYVTGKKRVKGAQRNGN